MRSHDDLSDRIFSLSDIDKAKGVRTHWLVFQDNKGRQVMFADPSGKFDNKECVDDPMSLLVDFFLEMAVGKSHDSRDLLDKYHVQVQANFKEE